jgi:hypothetical protein
MGDNVVCPLREWGVSPIEPASGGNGGANESRGSKKDPWALIGSARCRFSWQKHLNVLAAKTESDILGNFGKGEQWRSRLG